MPSFRVRRISTGDSEVQWTETSDRQGPRPKWHQSRNGPTKQSSLDKNVWTVWIAVTWYIPCWDCLNFTCLLDSAWCGSGSILLSELLISLTCSRNWVPVPGSKIYYPVPNLSNNYPVLRHRHTKYHKFLPVSAAVLQFQTIFYFFKALLTSQKFDDRFPVALMHGTDKLWAYTTFSFHLFTYLLNGILNRQRVPG